jgi:peroxiredoxin
MRGTVALAIVLAGVALALPSCARLDFFKRRESARIDCAAPCAGAPAPDFDAEDLAGKRVKLSDYRGKVVVLVFWYRRCIPCRAMIPHERELVERYRDKPFAMISVYSDQDYDQARKVVAEQNMTWPIVKAGVGPDAITRTYNVDLFPTIFVIDGAGMIRHARISGYQLDSAVAQALAEAKGK